MYAHPPLNFQEPLSSLTACLPTLPRTEPFKLHEHAVYMDVCERVSLVVDLASGVQRPRMAYPMELMQFHSEDYVNFLARVTPDNQEEMQQQLIQAGTFVHCCVGLS